MVELAFDRFAQREHRTLHHAGEDVGLGIGEDPRRHVDETDDDQLAMQRIEVDAVGTLESLDDDVGGFAEQPGPDHHEEHADERGDQHEQEQRSFLAEDLPEPLDRLAEVLAAFGRNADTATRPEARTTGLGPGGREELAIVLGVTLRRWFPLPRARGTVCAVRSVRFPLPWARGTVGAVGAHATAPWPICDSTISM